MSTVIALESFMAALPDLMPLFRMHWSETGTYREIPGRMPLSPNIDTYRALERSGALLTLVARREGAVVGYYIATVNHAIHYSTTIAGITDIPYVHPDVRGRGVGVRLFLTAEKHMRARGAKLWMATSKIDSALHPSMDRLLKWAGFEPCDLVYRKWLGD